VTLAAPPQRTDAPEDDVRALFKEARRRRRRRLAALGCLLAALGVVVGLLASSGGAPPKRPRAAPQGRARPPSVVGHVVLRGDGIGRAAFGQAETVAIAELDEVLGRPLDDESTGLAGNCDFDSATQWRTISAYFFHDRFVGYATVSLKGFLLHSNANTLDGLRLGDPLTRARLLYGDALTTSTAQGGSWSVTTSTGTLAGLLTSEVDQTSPRPRIEDITAGSVGCPAASP
jgi:hypothetical protein